MISYCMVIVFAMSVLIVLTYYDRITVIILYHNHAMAVWFTIFDHGGQPGVFVNQAYCKMDRFFLKPKD